MKTMKDAYDKAVFQPKERLAESQIKALFSRMARKNKRMSREEADSDSPDEDDADDETMNIEYNDLKTEIVDSFEEQ